MKEKWKTLLRHPAVIVFSSFIILFSLADNRANNRAFSELENRSLAKKPTVTRTNLLAVDEDKKFSYLYETYVNDQFLGRDVWITLKSRVEGLLMKTENNGILYGDNGTMYQKFYTVDTTQLENNTKAIERFISRHTGLVKVMIVPSADMVSPNAPSAPFVDELPYLQDMATRFGANGTFIDLLPAFTAHQSEPLYYATDHHWTTSGAYLAYQQFAAEVGKGSFTPSGHTATTVDDFFGTLYSKSKLYSAVPDTLTYYSDLTNPMAILQGGTLEEQQLAANAGLETSFVDLYDETKLEVRDKYAMFLYGNNGFSRVEGNGTGKVLVIKDSYANCFVPFLTADYAQIDIIDLRNLRSSVDKIIAENGYDDVLILYNFQSYQADKNLPGLNLYNS